MSELQSVKLTRSFANNFYRLAVLISISALVAAGLVIVSISKASATEEVSVGAGEARIFNVPANVSHIHFVLAGGNGQQGQGSCRGSGGAGAVLTGTVEVEEGDSFYIRAGRNGEDRFPYEQNGGDLGGSGGLFGILYVNEVLIAIAGGGGGGGAGVGDCEFSSGGKGGSALANSFDGDDGSPGYRDLEPVDSGGGGKQDSEGWGGMMGGNSGWSGSDNSGGGGAIGGGGGGGDGYYGGGGGAGNSGYGGGGGAGSSYINEEFVNDPSIAPSANPTGLITYEIEEPPPSTATTTTTVSDSPQASDSDGDGVSDDIEDASPNNGDANNDGIADSEQDNVTSFVSKVSGSYVTVISSSPDNCSNNSVDVSVENVDKDPEYSYPNGLVKFELHCDPSASATMEMIFFDAGDAKDFVARKFINDAFLTLQGASIENVNIGGVDGVKLTYSVNDGGELDADGQVNGVIVDPAGLGIRGASGSLAATGSSIASLLYATAVLSAVGALFLIASRRRQFRLI